MSYVVCWMPILERDMDKRTGPKDFDTLGFSEHVIECFRNETLPNDLVWNLDGDGWSSQLVVWSSSGIEEPGNFHIGLV